MKIWIFSYELLIWIRVWNSFQKNRISVKLLLIIPFLSQIPITKKPYFYSDKKKKKREKNRAAAKPVSFSSLLSRTPAPSTCSSHGHLIARPPPCSCPYRAAARAERICPSTAAWVLADCILVFFLFLFGCPSTTTSSLASPHNFWPRWQPPHRQQCRLLPVDDDLLTMLCMTRPISSPSSVIPRSPPSLANFH